MLYWFLYVYLFFLQMAKKLIILSIVEKKKMHICKFCRMKKKRSFCCCCCCLYLMLFINYNNKKISRISSYKTVHSSINASTLLNSSEQYLPIIIDNVHSLPYIADQTFEIIVYILFWFFFKRYILYFRLFFVCLFVC